MTEDAPKNIGELIEIKFDELSTYDFTKVQDRLREISLEINPLVFLLDNAQFLIEGRVMNLSEGLPPKLEMGFIYNYKGILRSLGDERHSNQQEVKDGMFKIDLFVIANRFINSVCKSIRYDLTKDYKRI